MLILLLDFWIKEKRLVFGNLSVYKLVLLNWTTHFHDWNVFCAFDATKDEKRR